MNETHIFYVFQISKSNTIDDVNERRDLLLKIQRHEAQRSLKTQKYCKITILSSLPFPQGAIFKLINKRTNIENQVTSDHTSDQDFAHLINERQCVLELIG